MYPKCILIILLAIVRTWPLCVYAQVDIPVQQVLFQSGPANFEPNLGNFISQPDLLNHRVHDRIYRYVQFYQIPDNTVKATMEQNGIRFLYYIPNRTFLVSMPVQLKREILRKFRVRSIEQPAPEQKTSSRLTTESLPEWAVRGDQILLNIQYYGDLTQVWVSAQLVSRGYRIEKAFPSTEQLTVAVPIAKIPELAALPYVNYIEPIDPPGEPEDIPARALHRSNQLDSHHPSGRHYDGTGINILVRDDGEIGPHIDFQGRTSQHAGPFWGGHGDMVAGVSAGAGNLNPTAKGAATGAFIHVIDYEPTFTDNTLLLHQVDSVMITNSSYSNGCNTGYTLTTRRVDKQMYDNPSLLHVFSAGNSNNMDCGYGSGSQWGNITGGHKQGKNVMTTANVFASTNIAGSSSRGPAYDGRIKPDIAAQGNGQISPDINNTYFGSGGTSAASPSGAGVYAQLYQAYRELNVGNYPESPLIKACVLNTAMDLGNPGPDFKYGWGLVNGLRAVQTLENNRYFDEVISQGDTNTHTLTVPTGVLEFRVMVYWLDKEAAPNAGIALVNNLDMRVADPGGNETLPLVLNPGPWPNPSVLDLPAVPGIDNLNNVEQVRITNPTAGTYTLSVTGKAVPVGPQKYYVVYEFIDDSIKVIYPDGGEGFVPGETEKIHWDVHDKFGPFTLDYSTDGGTTWTNITGPIWGTRQYIWTVPDSVGGQVRVKVSRGGMSDQSDHNFSIIHVPQHITVASACPDSFFISWDSVAGATGYDIFLLGDQYMDSVGSSITNSFSLSSFPVRPDNWIAVRSTGPNGLRGRRSIAVNHSPGYSCAQNDDLSISRIVFPASPVHALCFSDTMFVSVSVKNEGLNTQSGFPVSYQLNNDSIVTAISPNTLDPGDSTLFIFASPVILSPSTAYSLNAWTGLTGDNIPSNDQRSFDFLTTDGISMAAPFTEDFEGLAICETDVFCNDSCILTNNWLNAPNVSLDDLDWLTDSAGTPSSGTGPAIDHNPGATSGKYLYLEVSEYCLGQEAQVFSPCIDLSTVLNPVLKFWYHMHGVDMGSLHVDVYDGHTLYIDVIPPISGDQGNNWQEGEVFLASFGPLVQVRFRGIAGAGDKSDIAIDDVSIVNAPMPPLTDFDADRSYTCPQQMVSFRDLTSRGAFDWSWDFFPNTLSYVNGTDSTSAHPDVLFLHPGTYSVSLIAHNAFGSDTLTKTDYITVGDGDFLPVAEDFQSGIFPPVNWRRENPDNRHTWETTTVVGSDGTSTLSAYMENYSYVAFEEPDFLETSPIDLTTSIAPLLTFDVAYVQSASIWIDELRIDISLDCGRTINSSIYSKAGPDLVTVGGQFFNPWSPTHASQWRKDSIDLSPYIGNSVVLRFTNIAGWGNNLFLDNIHIIEQMMIPPVSSFTLPAGPFCMNTPITVTSTASGTNQQHHWDFGMDASPASANSAGPHLVVYTSGGTKTISLVVSNGIGSDTTAFLVQVEALPEASFNFSNLGAHTYEFLNGSTNAINYHWDFGDDSTSTLTNPVHTYETTGTYLVQLITTNDCGADTAAEVIGVFNTDLLTDLSGLAIRIFPNPNTGIFDIRFEGAASRKCEIEVLDQLGRILSHVPVEIHSDPYTQRIDVSQLPAGIYPIRIRCLGATGFMRFVKK